MQNDVYAIPRKARLPKIPSCKEPTACSACLSFLPLPAHSFPPKQALNIFSMFGSSWIALAAFFGFFYGHDLPDREKPLQQTSA